VVPADAVDDVVVYPTTVDNVVRSVKGVVDCCVLAEQSTLLVEPALIDVDEIRAALERYRSVDSTDSKKLNWTVLPVNRIPRMPNFHFYQQACSEMLVEGRR
jgi:hypothetical protein